MTTNQRDAIDSVEQRIRDAAKIGDTELDLSLLHLKELPENTRYLSSLQRLNLAGNELTELPDWIGDLTRLRELDLTRNALSVLPETLARLTSLQILRLRENRLTTLPNWDSGFSSLCALRELDLTRNALSVLPETLARLTNLRILRLRENRLTTLPNWHSGFNSLCVLDLSGNQLATLPEVIGYLAALKALDVSRNELTSVANSLGNLSRLEVLDLSTNRLAALPMSLGGIASLQLLNISANQLTALPTSFVYLQNLRAVLVSRNPLSSTPEFILKHSEPEQLDLSRKGLLTIPDGICDLKTLKKLDVSGNNITELPEALSKLTSLETLYVNDNNLRSLPASLGGLTALKELDVSDNELEDLPESLGQLTNLSALFLHRNSHLSVPAELLGNERRDGVVKGTRAPDASLILDYYRRSWGGRPLNEAKLILVGRGGVGKTSLVRRLIENRFDPTEKLTEGIQIVDWHIELDTREHIRLHVWDFGGQEIMHATHQFFLTERSLYLLALSGREGCEDADADYWLRLIESFGGHSPIIVVLNKFEERPFSVNQRGLQQKFEGIRAFVPTDCNTNLGIRSLRDSIQREVDRMDNLRVRFPDKWFEIKDSLGGMRNRNFLTFEAYRAECARFGEEDAEAQERLAAFLHLLGIALNFKDDPRLHDTHVLNPHWVTNGIYRILNSSKLSEQKGEIRVNDLRDILDNVNYPRAMHGFLLDLMRKFELCFPFETDADGHYLIPELLEKEEPPETAAFQPDECLNFEYHYPVLPEGIIPRFIAGTYAMSSERSTSPATTHQIAEQRGRVTNITRHAGEPSHGVSDDPLKGRENVQLARRQTRWRSGVIVSFDRNRALVKGAVQERKVTITVSGPIPGRRNLLSIIRAHFERIHASIARLEPKSMVPIPGAPHVKIEFEKLLAFEENGENEIREIINGRLVTFKVPQLLNGVDVSARGRRERAAAELLQPARLFISYSHKDESLRAQLDAHLKLLQRVGLVQAWDDHMLKPGENFRTGIDDHLECADIILLLVSADFINSDFCYEIEMARALERHQAGEAKVIPVIVRDVSWQKSKFGVLQALPSSGRPVSLWTNRDTAWRRVAEGIQNEAEKMLLRRLLGRAERDLFVVGADLSDPLFYNFLQTRSNNVAIRVLLNKNNHMDSMHATSNWRARVKARITELTGNALIFVDDNECWAIGTSTAEPRTLGDAYLVRLPHDEAAAERDKYENIWTHAVAFS